MNTRFIVPIVEGHGEVEAVPILIRRYLYVLEVYDINPVKPFRAPGRSGLLRPDGIERFVRLACLRQGCSAVLVLCDADEDCPAELGPVLLSRAQSVCGQMPVRVVLAKRMFESWFLGSIETIRGKRYIDPSAPEVAEPEEVSNPEHWVSQQMPKGRRYRETVDQAPLASAMDFDLARSRCPSMDKFLRAMDDLVRQM